MKYYTIYEITNLINGKTYIGKHETDNPYDDYMGSGKNIKRAIQKYGIEWFDKYVMFIFGTEAEMNVKEKELVTEEFCCLNSNYNICPGGQGGFGYINSSIDLVEHRKELGFRSSKKHKKRLDTDMDYRNSFLERISKSYSPQKAQNNRKEKFPKGTFFGKTHSKETLEKMSASASLRKGSKNSSFGTCWITNGTDNKKVKKNDVEQWFLLGYYKGRNTKV